MEQRHPSSARVLAPIALVVFGIALVVILGSAGGSDKSSEKAGPTKEEQRDLRLKKRRARARATHRASGQSVYVVKAGDTLGGIAEKTGVPVDRLQELNPNVDPQALTSGQRLKLK